MLGQNISSNSNGSVWLKKRKIKSLCFGQETFKVDVANAR